MSELPQETEARRLGSHYRLGELLGRGAMGEVYVAEDTETGERLAAKLLRAEHTDDDEVTARFLQERKLLRELTHPNIVRVRELVVDRDQIAIVMDLIEGEDVRRRLHRERRLAPAEAVRICADVLAALSMAHSVEPPVQHRDVKPDNILLGVSDGGPSHVYLTDFGVARLAQVGSSVKLTSGVGTADYMAPEMMGTTAGSAADVYAVGVTLYELVAGHTPFGRDTFSAIAMRHVTCVPPRIPGIPDQLWAQIEAMLVKNPLSRPTAATAEARLREVLPSLTGLPPLADVPEPTQWQQVAGVVPAADPVLGPFEEAERGTVLKGDAAAPVAQLPVARLDSSIGVRRDGVGFDEQTQATVLGGREAHERDRAAAAPAVTTVAPAHAARSHRRTWILAGSAVAVVAVAATVAVVVVRGHHHPAATQAAQTNAAAMTQIPLDPAPATQLGVVPLEVTRTPSYDLSSQTLTVDLSIQNGTNAAVAGPLLEAVPDPSGQGCASMSWQQELDVLTAQQCGFQVPVSGGSLAAHQTLSTSYTVSMPIAGADSSEQGIDKIRTAVSAYLQKVDRATQNALQGIGPDTDQYAVQRLTGIEVDVDQSAARAGQRLPLSVYPQFPSGVDKLDPLYAYNQPQGTPLGHALGMRPTFSPAAGGCGTFDGSQSNPIVSSSTPQCTVTANLGGYVQQDSETFAVR